MTTRKQWAKRINEEWHALRAATVEAFVLFGQSLIAAKKDLTREKGHGYWIEFVENDVEFDRKIANSFMRISQWVSTQKAVNDRHLAKRLPPDYNTIDKLTRLSGETFQRLLNDGTINPSLARNEVSKILRGERVQADEQRVFNLVPVAGKFRTIILDPAWEYDWLSIAGRAKPGYAMQSLDDLAALDVRAWAEHTGTHLYCWTTNNFMGEACKLVAHWGFQHRTVLTWIKPPPFGLGSYFRNSTEHCLFATLGDTSTRHAGASTSTHFEAPRGEHSEKPELFYDMVRRCSFPPYGEGNQRTPRPDFANLFTEQEAA